MNIFVATSDSCISALKPFSFLFNKFWHFKEKVTVLNRGVITDVDLPDNFSIVSLGENKGMDYWCDDLRNYFLSIDDDHFIFMQESFLSSSRQIKQSSLQSNLIFTLLLL